MRDYVREQTFGGFVKSTFGIYFANFPVFFVIYLIPLFPLGWLSTYAGMIEDQELGLVATLVNVAIAVFVSAAMTVAVSDVCLGNRPGVVRSYKRLTRVIGPLLLTYLMVIPIIIVGMVLLVIPGIAAATYLLFALAVVVLERSGGVAAIKRSYFLVKGSFWRYFGVLIVMGLLIGLSHMVIVWLLVIGMVMLGLGDNDPGIFSLLAYVFSSVLGPMQLIVIVLLYYDSRVRKEHFDNEGLAQELMQ